MGIDLFTFVAQVINLIILLFLLRKFLYIPILKAIDERQRIIASELNSAEMARKKAELSAKEYADKMQELEVQKQEILFKVKLQAEKLSENLQQEAKQQYKKSQKQWNNRLLSEQNNFENALQKLIAQHFNNFAQNALKEMAGTDVNGIIIKYFLEKIEKLSARENKDFAEAFNRNKSIYIESANSLSKDIKNNLEVLLHKQWNLPDSIKFIYIIKPDLISGISIQTGEQRIEWSLNGYLEEFRKNMNNEILQLLTKGEK